MVVLNYSGEEINAKIVYYGPGLSGKTTNLEYIHEKMPAKIKGKMVSMKTRTDRTLFFDFLPLDMGDINGYSTRLLLYTVPGQVYYNATRKLVLKGVDAVVFVADSSRAKLGENIESLRNLEDNLNEHGLSLDHIPWVIQYNKRDLPDAMPVAELEQRLNLLKVPSFQAVASEGGGVYDTFKAIAGILYNQLKNNLEKTRSVGGTPPDPASAAAMRATAGPAAPVPNPAMPGDEVGDTVDNVLREMGDPSPAPEPEQLATKTAPFDMSAMGQSEAPFAQNTNEQDVGNVLELDEEITAPREDVAEDFITDPMRSAPARPEQPTAPEPAAFRSHEETESLPEGIVTGPVMPVEPEPEPQPQPQPQPSYDPPAATSSEPPPAPEVFPEPAPVAPSPVPEAPPVDSHRPAYQATGPVATESATESIPERTEELTIEVPVRLTRNQISKSVPIKLELKIQVVDD